VDAGPARLVPDLGTKSAPMGFTRLQTQLGLMICARQSLVLIIDNSPEAPLRDMLRQQNKTGLAIGAMLVN
jgi:hypothetical protein